MTSFAGSLPSGEAFARLVGLTRFYADQEWDFDVQLILKAAEVPACRLGETGARARGLAGPPGSSQVLPRC